MTRSVLIACALLMVGGSFGNYLRYREAKPDSPPHFESIPYAAESFAGEEKRFEAYSYEILKADTTTLRLYRGGRGETYWLFVAYLNRRSTAARYIRPSIACREAAGGSSCWSRSHWRHPMAAAR